MRLACIYCEVLFRELCLTAAASEAIVDLIALPQGLHNTPADLRLRVQQEIDRLERGPESLFAHNTEGLPPKKYDAILLGYALCSNGVVGLTSQRVPLVIPRGHDCVTLLLGSKERYQEYFHSHHGVYWYSSGWIERTMQPGKARWNYTRQHYREEYGEENADFLMDMEQHWFKEYEWATYIDWELPTAERDRQFTRECASFLGWQYDEVKGNRDLLGNFVGGCWNTDDFLVVPPGSCIEPSFDPGIVKACAGCVCHGTQQMKATQPSTNQLYR